MSVGIDVGLKNLAICAIDPESPSTPYYWELISVKKPGKSLELCILEVIDDCINHLSAHPGSLTFWKHVYIERQPSCCRRSQMAMMDWLFILFKDRMRKSKVTLVNANTKWGIHKSSVDLSSYTKRKQSAIDLVTTLVNPGMWDPKIKKKDDLADAYLLSRINSWKASEHI